MRSIILSFVTLFLALTIPCNLYAADDKATPAEVYEKVVQAAGVLQSLGEEGLKAFQSKDSEFVWKDTYVWVIDCKNWTNAAHPTMPKLVGMDLKDIQCKKTGKYFFQEFCEVGQDPNGGWVEYYWPKPGHPEDELFRKITFVLPVEGTPWLVASGIYDDSMTIKELNKTLR